MVLYENSSKKLPLKKKTKNRSVLQKVIRSTSKVGWKFLSFGKISFYVSSSFSIVFLVVWLMFELFNPSRRMAQDVQRFLICWYFLPSSGNAARMTLVPKRSSFRWLNLFLLGFPFPCNSKQVIMEVQRITVTKVQVWLYYDFLHGFILGLGLINKQVGRKNLKNQRRMDTNVESYQFLLCKSKCLLPH